MARRKRGNPINGWVILDKPIDLNSTTAVAIVRRLFKAQKAGHAGTLDPLATGVLPIALGEATKTVQYVMEGGKNYRFTVKWGEETQTDDLEGKVTSSSQNRPTVQEIKNCLQNFTGTIQQTPPAYSAIKINGERAYKLARAGQTVAMKARDVQIYDLTLRPGDDENEAEFEAHCGKGTYIRSLGRDLGRELGCLGHITKLRRISSGPFTQAMSISLEKLQELSHSADAREALQYQSDHSLLPQADIEANKPHDIELQQHVHPSMLQHLYPIETALDDIPALAINEMQATQIRVGQSVTITGREAPIIKGPAYTMVGSKIVAMGSVSQGIFKPSRVFNLDQKQTQI